MQHIADSYSQLTDLSTLLLPCMIKNGEGGGGGNDRITKK